MAILSARLDCLFEMEMEEGSLWVESIRQILELTGALGNATSTAKLTVAVVPGSATCRALARIAASAC